MDRGSPSMPVTMVFAEQILVNRQDGFFEVWLQRQDICR